MKNQNKIFLSILILAFVALFSMNNRSVPPKSEAQIALSIDYKVPGDLPSAKASEEQLATFAWNEFFALNWQAKWVVDTNNVADRSRGIPNKTWDFKTSGHSPELTVWETYIHRAELRPANGKRYETNLNKGKPNYTFIDPVNTMTNGVNLSDYWVNLDEDNEIGSCYVFAYDELQVMYMAKSNLVEYNYVRDKFPDDALLFRAVQQSAQQGYEDYLKEISIDQSCNSDSASHVVCLPCGDESGEGAIEIKTAWRKLTSVDDRKKFLVREAVYYTYDEKGGEPVAQVGSFGLIGLHIIQKTKNYPAFVFASWEQEDVRKADMQTIGLDASKIDSHEPLPVKDRAISKTIEKVNKQAKKLITSKNTESVWQYYKLIGVQGEPINYKDKDQDPNYFMANYVIESDSLLTYFHGSFGDPFNEEIKNVVFNGQTFNMGGCQGCHGQAQKGGTDFSFLLDFGAGKPVSKPDGYLSFQVAEDSAGTPGSAQQLKTFIEKYNKK